MFLSMVTTDPNSPSQNIDIYLWLLIDELKQLWSSMTLTYNVSRKQNFQMKATLIWTINDFSVYGIIFCWSTHEKLACPYYMENNKTFTLTNIGKTSFFYCHWQFLSTDHKYRKKKDLFVGRVERDVALPVPSGEELFDVVSQFDDIIFGF
jgi:hypothetical protein